MPDLYEVTGDGALNYNLHAGQTRAWESKARFILMSAGFQSGKTSFAPLWLYREIQECGKGDYIAATATYDLFKIKFLPEMEQFFIKTLGWGTYHATDRVIYGRGQHKGSRIILRSADSTGGLESGTALAAVGDEFGQVNVTVEAWEALQRRLALRRGRILFPTTPYYGQGWLKTKIYDRWKAGDPDYDVVQYSSLENPAFLPEEFERMKRDLPDWKFRMFMLGEFANPAGLIYSDFIQNYYPEGHLLPYDFKIRPEWPRLVGMDFGGTEHTALVWIAEELIEGGPHQGEPTGRYIAFREAIGGGLTGQEHAREALAYNEPVRAWYGGAKSESNDRLNWQMEGCSVAEPLIPEVEPGIDRVIALFKQKRLYVCEGLGKLRQELGAYSREVDDAGMPIMKILHKERFHLCDALRYLCSVIPPSPPKYETETPIDAQSRKVEDLRAQMERERREELSYSGGLREEYL